MEYFLWTCLSSLLRFLAAWFESWVKVGSFSSLASHHTLFLGYIALYKCTIQVGIYFPHESSTQVIDRLRASDHECRMTAKKPALNKRPSNYITQASSLKLENEPAQYAATAFIRSTAR
jgi:hypothetical protein